MGFFFAQRRAAVSSTSQSPDLDGFLGAAFIGIHLSTALWGTGCIQASYYFKHSRDAIWFKILISTVIVLSTAHQSLIISGLYSYTVVWYGHVEFLNTVPPTWAASNGVSAFVGLIVQLYFIWRVWRLSRQNIALAIFLGSQAVAAFVVLMIFTAKFAQLPNSSSAAHLAHWGICLDALGASGDISISACLIYLLYRTRCCGAMSNSVTDLTNRLIMFSVQTALVTSVCAVAMLVTLALWPQELIYTIFFCSVSKLYVNTLLANLNARRHLSMSWGDEKTLPDSVQLSQLVARPGDIRTTPDRHEISTLE